VDICPFSSLIVLTESEAGNQLARRGSSVTMGSCVGANTITEINFLLLTHLHNYSSIMQFNNDCLQQFRFINHQFRFVLMNIINKLELSILALKAMQICVPFAEKLLSDRSYILQIWWQL